MTAIYVPEKKNAKLQLVTYLNRKVTVETKFTKIFPILIYNHDSTSVLHVCKQSLQCKHCSQFGSLNYDPHDLQTLLHLDSEEIAFSLLLNNKLINQHFFLAANLTNECVRITCIRYLFRAY